MDRLIGEVGSVKDTKSQEWRKTELSDDDDDDDDDDDGREYAGDNREKGRER